MARVVDQSSGTPNRLGATRYEFGLANATDDADLRQILAETPMSGRISVSLRREPSFFDAAMVDGDFRQVVVCRERGSQRVVGFGCRSVREMYVNGQPMSIGYLSMLRGLKQHRNRGLLARGYKYLRDLHGDGRTELYLTTIAAGNEQAMAVLTSGRAGLPQYHAAGNYHTVAIPVRKRANPPRNTTAEIRSATPADLELIVDFLNRVGPARQFFPKYRASDFFHSSATLRDLRASDLLLAFRNDRLVGMLAGWDQRGYRQIIVNSYAPPLRWMRGLYNWCASFRGQPGLPKPGEAFRCLAGLLPVVEDDHREVFLALIETLLMKMAARKLDYLLLGLHEADALFPCVASLGTATYVTQLYLVGWEDGETLRHRLDGRPAYLELGCL